MTRPIALIGLSLLTILAALCGTPRPAAAGSEGSAMVADLTGTVTRAGRPLDLLMEVAPGTVLTLGANASITLLALDDGTETSVSGPGTATVTEGGVIVADGATATRRTLEIASLSLRPDDYQQAAVVMRGVAQEAVSGMRPDGGAVLTPPVLSWIRHDPGTGACSVQVLDAERHVLLDTQAAGTSLALPTDLPAAPGSALGWTLTCPGSETREASFTLAEATLRDRFAAGRPAPDAPFARRVAYARALAAAGLAYDARAAFHRLAVERPDSLHLRILADLPLDGPVPPSQ